MPGGHSRSHFSERFGFHPELWVRTQGFQKDAAEKVKLSRNPLYKYWWGSCGECHGVERCYFHLKNATTKELNSFENPVMFGGAKHLRMWCRVVKHCRYWDCDETSVEGYKSTAEVHLYLYGLVWSISSNSNKLAASWHLSVHTDNLLALAGSGCWVYSWSLL